MAETKIMDSVKTFAEYTHSGVNRVYQYTRAKDFPVIQMKKRGRKLIDRAAAIEWMKEKSKENSRWHLQ